MYTMNGRGGNGVGSQPMACAACKHMRRRCYPECLFAPYFPPDQAEEFDNLRRVFGVSNVTKLVADLNPQEKEMAMVTMKLEAKIRRNNPVHGCAGLINDLKMEVQRCREEMQAMREKLFHCQQIDQKMELQKQLQQQLQLQQMLFCRFSSTAQPPFGGFQYQNPPMINPLDESYTIGNMRNFDPGHSYPPPYQGDQEPFNRMNGNNLGESSAQGVLRTAQPISEEEQSSGDVLTHTNENYMETDERNVPSIAHSSPE
ncbi:uncharacterized protein LOC143892577 [Tasmannia lanceolata]|uniref:uncharacterized protein LOC143892577 n=1 Tax=Tasmannia lanceolata TaxID=3420 RepID=UPI0040629B49